MSSVPRKSKERSTFTSGVRTRSGKGGHDGSAVGEENSGSAVPTTNDVVGYGLSHLTGDINVDIATNNTTDGCSEEDDLSHSGEDVPGETTVSPDSNNNESWEGWY